MCTIVIFWKTHPAADVIMGLNRDEFFARPTDDYRRWTTSSEGAWVGGRDGQSGGTWFAIGREVVSVVTNHRGHGTPTPGPVSRGKLVLDAALSLDAAAALEGPRSLAPEAAGPYHLLAFDRHRLLYLTNAGGEHTFREVEPGLHVLGNFGLDAPDDPVVAGLLSSLEGTVGGELSTVESRLKHALATHGEGAPCVHLGPYGTRSSAVLTLGPDVRRLFTTDGPPCDVSWRDHSHLLGTDEASLLE